MPLPLIGGLGHCHLTVRRRRWTAVQTPVLRYRSNDPAMDTQDAPRWMTYVEFGKLIDGSPEAARQLAIRLRLRKQRDNDGRVQVWVDPDAVSHRNTRRTPVQSGVQHPVHTPVQTNEINALQDH